MKYQSRLKSVTKRKNKSKQFITTIIIIFVLIFSYSVLEDVGGSKKATSNVTVSIPSGAGTSQIAEILKGNKIIKYPLIFKIIATTKNSNFKMGEHIVNSSMSYSDIIKIMSNIGDVEDGIRVTIPEGYEVSQIIDELVSKGLADRNTLQDVIKNGDFNYDFVKKINRKENKLEGYLFPATYTFNKNMSEYDMINAMLKKFNSEFTDEIVARSKQLNMTIDEVITLASIIEREAAAPNEFKTVSSVFHNRLDSNIALESCATVQYIIKERKSVLSIEDTKINSAYNTYKNKGLPVGPIASPGMVAINAALYPERTDYLFFVAASDGKHIFSKTFEQHKNAMKSIGL